MLSYSRTLRFLSVLCLVGIALLAQAQQAVTTYQFNTQRQGWNSNETTLTKANVNTNTFGLLFSLPVDGQVYAEPLYVPSVTIPGQGTHNVVFVATQHDSLYAFDADTGGNPLWMDNFGPSVPNGDTGSGDINPEIGITGTPVIRTTGTGTGYIYLVAKTKETVSNNTVYVQRIHAIDITNGTEMTTPMEISASVPGTGEGSDGTNVAFNPLVQAQRPGLLLINNTLYIGWASHGDNGPYHGWIMSYNALTLAQISVFNTTPNALNDPSGYPIAAGGVWQGGGGLASDGTSLYFSTGNGTYDPSTGSYGDSVLRLSTTGGLSVADSFTPSDQQSLDDSDEDLGSGGVMLLPSSVGSVTYPNLLVQSGKEGTLYLLKDNSLGGYNSPDQVTELPGVMGGIWGNPCYYNGNVYYGPSGWPIVEFTVSNGQFTTTSPVNTSSNGFGYPGPTPTVSSNGTTNAILWAIDTSGYSNGTPAVLWAYDADSLATLYSSSNTNGRDTLPVPTKFSVPLVENGKVYVGATGSVSVFGLGSWTAAPVSDHASGSYPSSISINVTDSTPSAQIYYTTDGSTPTQSSTPVSGSIPISTSGTYTFRAFASGYNPGAPSTYYYQIAPVVGTGNGLTGLYYNNMNLTPPVTNSEIDAVIDFNWNGASPISGLGGDNWSAQWEGTVQAPSTGTYYFRTQSDDGCRLFVNGSEIISDWNDHAPTYDTSGAVSLVAGQKYSIEMDYYQDGGGSLAELMWSGPGFTYQDIPTTQMYSTSYPLSDIYASPASVMGGQTTHGVVQLLAAAGSNGLTVSLTSASSVVQVPSTVTVPSGDTGVSFVITTSPISATQTITIKATYNGATVQNGVTLNPYLLSNFYTSPSTVYGGSSTNGVVQMLGPAGPNDNVSLSSGNSAVMVPASVKVPVNSTGVSFSISTTNVSTATTVTLTATYGSSQKTTTLTVNPAPPLAAFTINNTAPYMTYQVTGTVTLSNPVSTTTTLHATSSTSYVSVSTQPVVATGQKTANFILTANPVPNPIPSKSTISVTFGNVTKTVGMEVLPIGILSAAFSTATLHAGQNATLTIKTKEAAGAVSFPITLKNSSTALTVPASATMAPHTYSVTVNVQAAATVTGTNSVTVYADLCGQQVSATITVEP